MVFNAPWGPWGLGPVALILVKFGKQPVQFSLQSEYDFANDEIGPANTLRFTMKILFPK